MQRFKNILLVLKDSHLTGPATLRAVDLARINRARLTVIDVLPIKPLGRRLQKSNEKMEQMHRDMLAERKRELEKLLFELSQEIYIRVVVLSGKFYAEIIHYAQENNCDLLIKSVEEEKRFSSLLFGSTDLQLLRKCPCPVWMVKQDDLDRQRKILAAVDLEFFEEGDELNELNSKIIEIATSLAYRESSSLSIINAWIVFDGGKLAKRISKHYKQDVASWVEEQRQSIDSAQQAFRKKVLKHLEKNGMSELDCTFHFIQGEAEDVIADLAAEQEMDLVVMGTVARSELAGFFMGNTSEEVLRRINSSVLAVKPSGFVSPVAVESS